MTNSIANLGQFTAEADVVAIRKDMRVEQARKQIEALFDRGYGDRIPDEDRPLLGAFAEEYLTNWLFKAAASDAQHPRFVRNFMPAHHWHGHNVPGARTGGDNPDNCYRLAGIAHGTSYRVTGRVVDHKPGNISFTLTGNYGTSVTIQTIEDHELDVDSGGNFVITIDDTSAAGRRNHLMTAPHVKFLFVRDSMMDWETETPVELQIERIGSAKAGPISHDEMAARAAFRAVEDVPLYFWFQNVWSGLAPNSMRPPFLPATKGVTGGLVTQGIAHGSLSLGEDDAAIIEYHPMNAGYAGLQLTEWLYRSLDYQQVQSSLTAAQSVVNADGRIRCVVSKRDPGVANWLDPSGHTNSFIILRWQSMPSDTAGSLHAEMRIVKLDDLQRALPADTRRVTADERKAQLGARLNAYARRF